MKIAIAGTGYVGLSNAAPFKRLGATIRVHMDGIINSYKHQMSNGTAESINSKIQTAIVRARGLRTYDNLFTVIYFNTPEGVWHE